MRKNFMTGSIIALAVALVWIYAVSLRLPYMDQIPVFDADVTTANMIMWARGWLHEGIFNIGFATPFSPLSVETPTLESRLLYQSWPPGSVVPIYLLSVITGLEPSAEMINWLNTVNHGVVAMGVAFAAYNLCMTNAMGRISSGLLAVGTSFVVLLPRGLAYTFGQLYCVTVAIFPYLAIALLLETVYLRTSDEQLRRRIAQAFLIVMGMAFLVDWSAYTFFAFWFLFRVAGGMLGHLPRWPIKRIAWTAAYPFIAFGVYLVWRFSASGSVADVHGIVASLQILLTKVGNRVNVGDDQITGFWPTFMQMHDYWFSPHLRYLLLFSAIAAVILLLVCYRAATNREDRRKIFITLGIAMLVSVPFYLHMIIFSQHTAIHQWAIAKVLFAYAFLPFVVLPIALKTAAALLRQRHPTLLPGNWWPRMGLLLLGASTAVAAEMSGTTYPLPYLLGRIQKDVYQTYTAVYRSTVYHDVVFSPTWEAPRLGFVVGVTNKRIYPAHSFAEIDKQVKSLCGKFNVAIAMPDKTPVDTFDGRKADEVVVRDGLRLLRYVNYRGPAQGCSPV